MSNSSNILKLAIIFVVSILLQLLIFNNLEISGFINPYIYIIAIMAMPYGTSTGMLMTVSFAAGLTLDLFCDTPGMHAAACVVIGYLRQYILKFIAFRDAYKADDMPSADTYGIVWYFKYTALMVSAHHIVLFFIEQFDTMFFWPTLLRIILSIAATTALIVMAQYILPLGGGKNSD